MRQRYFNQNEDLPFLEDLFYKHTFDEDTGMIRRSSLSPILPTLIFIGIFTILLILK